MSFEIIRSALGKYDPIGNPDNADIVSAHSFGTVTDKGSVNNALARFAYGIADGRPIAVDRMLVAAFPRGETDVDMIVEGEISNTIGHGVGSWGTLVETKNFMEQQSLFNPMLVAQAHHVGRVALQAKKLGISPIIPADLPNNFDTESEQRWTRSVGWWVPREIVGSVVLKKRGEL